MRREEERRAKSPASSSSEFEFSVSISPMNGSSALCPADELFYKSQILPLQLSPRLSLVRTLGRSESSSSSPSSSPSDARDSRDSSSSDDSTVSSHAPPQHDECCDSSLPSSVTGGDDDFFKLLPPRKNTKSSAFSASRFSSVFKKDPKNVTPSVAGSDTDPSPVKKLSSTIRKYLKKVKPLYGKLSQKHQQVPTLETDQSLEAIYFQREKYSGGRGSAGGFSGFFSGYLQRPRREICRASCPSSPSDSGVLSQSGCPVAESVDGGSDISSMEEELQSVVQGTIAHCKNSVMQ